MSQEVEITMTYGFRDQGKNDFAVLFYRPLADYSLISRHVNVVTYPSLDCWPSEHFAFSVFILLMSDQSISLDLSGNFVLRKERGREVSLAGFGH